MASTITNFSSIVDVQYPVPGQDNDTQGFRSNFRNLVSALDAAATEITDLQITNVGIINELNSIASPSTLALSTLTAKTIISTGTIVSSGDITANGRFVGDGSLLTNIPFTNVTSIGTLTSLSVANNIQLGNLTGRVNMSMSNDKLILDGASSIRFVTTQTIEKTLVDIDYIGTTGTFVSTLTVNSVIGLAVGYTFQYYSTETTVHVVNSINTITNKITTDPYDHKPVLDAGYGGAGSILTFKIAKINDIIELQTQVTSNTNAISKLSNVFTTTEIDILSKSIYDATTATLTAENNRLLLSGVSGITLVGSNTVSANLVSYSGSGPSLFINTLTLNTVTGIDVGYTFKLYSTETSVHTVLSVNTVTNSITTDPFDPAVAQDNGVDPGDLITFTQGLLIGTVSYASSTPAVPNGKPTDKKGFIYADTSTIYLCYSDYINPSTPIWKEINTSRIDELRLWSVSTGTRIATLETLSASTGTRVTALETQAASTNTRITNIESSATFFVSSAPLSPIGSPGDRRGYIFANSTSTFICIANYNGTPIWTRTLSNISW
jgi:hypothetical protein